jgi:ABC-type sugar transport system ATPase subunit
MSRLASEEGLLLALLLVCAYLSWATLRGKAVLMISSELPEVLGMSDRILVLHEGRLTGEIADARHATQEQVLKLAVG